MTPQQVYDKHRRPNDPPWEALPATARRGWAVAARTTAPTRPISGAHVSDQTPDQPERNVLDYDSSGDYEPLPPKPVFDVLSCTYGEALAIYLYAHLQIADVRDVGQAEIIRGQHSAADHSEAAWIFYITRGADSKHRKWGIPASVDEFSFELQQTLARYAAGLVDAEVAEAIKTKAAAAESHRLAHPDPVDPDPSWTLD